MRGKTQFRPLRIYVHLCPSVSICGSVSTFPLSAFSFLLFFLLSPFWSICGCGAALLVVSPVIPTIFEQGVILGIEHPIPV